MASHSPPSTRTVDFSGLTDELITRLVNELKLDKFIKRSASDMEAQWMNEETNKVLSIENMSPEDKRKVLTDFVRSHPEAEISAGRLILQYVGIDKSVFLPRRDSSESRFGSSPELYQKIPLQHKEEDIMPNFSPVSWLSNDSWSSMSYNDKLVFMDHATDGGFKSEHIFRSHDRNRYYPTPDLFKRDAVAFGKGGIDRVVIGNGARRVLVLAGIHGNEPCGVDAINLLLQRKALFSGHPTVNAQELTFNEKWQPMDELFDSLTVEFLVGNPTALQNNTRFMKKNLNRLFDIHTLCNDASAEEEGYTEELQRARIIAESIRNADFVLDVHSCSADVASFALPSSSYLSEEVAELLPVRYVVESLAHMTLDGGTTLDCALLHDVPGVCVECGQHNHPDVTARAVSIISSFLALQLLDDDGSFAPLNQTEKPLVVRCDSAERVGLGFEWLNQYEEFSFVPENSPVFRDERGDVFSPEGGAYIIMPAASPVIGEEALFWAKAK
eukprot:g3094.t1 g3094   contig12:1405201-1406784(-)